MWKKEIRHHSFGGGPSQMVEPALWPGTVARMEGLEVLMSREVSHGPFCQGEPFLPIPDLGFHKLEKGILTPSSSQFWVMSLPNPSIYTQRNICYPSAGVAYGSECSSDQGCDPQVALVLLILGKQFTFHQYQPLRFPGGRKGPKRSKGGVLNWRRLGLEKCVGSWAFCFSFQSWKCRGSCMYYL